MRATLHDQIAKDQNRINLEKEERVQFPIFSVEDDSEKRGIL